MRSLKVTELTDLVESAINGMLSSLDPHSSYMSPKTFRDMQVQNEGNPNVFISVGGIVKYALN